MDGRRLLDAVVGVYVSLLILTTSALVQWASVGPSFSVGAALALGLGIAAVAALVVGTVEDLAETVASMPVAAVTVGLPLLFFPYLIVVAEPESTQALVAAAGLAAVVPGVGIPAGGTMLTNRRQREAATEIAVVTVGDHDENEWWTWVQLAGVVFMSIGMVIMGLGVAGGFFDGGTSLVTTLGGLVSTVASFFATDSRELTVTDTGLGIDRGFTRWDEFDGYRVTDDSVELVRPEWLNQAPEFDREEISDEDALIEGLNEFLPRLDEEGNQISGETESSPLAEYS